MKVLNRTDVPQSIKIITADGKHDTIQINRGRPVDLPAGAQIDPTMIAQYAAILKTDPPLVVPAAPVQETAADESVSDNE